MEWMPVGVSVGVTFRRFENGRGETVEGAVVREGLVRLHVNGRELATLMCTPHQLDLLALGFLRSEGIIAGLADVRLVKVCPSAACVEVWLRRAEFELPGPPTITSGCGGGVTFADLSAASQPLASHLRVSVGQLGRLMRALQDTQRTRGIHTSALAEDETLLVVVEDVGRHNTIDKLWGYCLVHDISPRDKILLSTGRISSEMLNKAARMGTPVVASRTSPTSLSLALAEVWQLTLVGYVRRDSLNVYTARERVVESKEEGTDAHL
jgi:FdhD protein